MWTAPRALLLGKLSSKHLTRIKRTVNDMYRESLPEGMRHALPSATPEEYWNEHCYPKMIKSFRCVKMDTASQAVSLQTSLPTFLWKRQKKAKIRLAEAQASYKTLSSRECLTRLTAESNLRCRGILVTGYPEDLHVH